MRAVISAAHFGWTLRHISMSAFVMTNSCRRLSVGTSCLEPSISAQPDASLRAARRTSSPEFVGGGSTPSTKKTSRSGQGRDYKVDEETGSLWLQAPYPPLPLSPRNPHPVYKSEGVDAGAAAIAYLRGKGLAGHSPKRRFFYLLCWILRHAARDLGFDIAPDGFVRVCDLFRFEPFRHHTIASFAEVVVKDHFDRFEVIQLPDLVNGELENVWWVRARASHSIQGVVASNKRIINMGKLQTVTYRAPLQNWPYIQKFGIHEGLARVIPLQQIDERYFGNIIPEQAKYICITIDAQKAADMGVTFFHTFEAELLAVGRNGVIPTQAIRSIVQLELKKEKLL